MKKLFFIIPFALFFLFCVNQAAKKEKIYISFEEINGYDYQFSDSSRIQNIIKIIITDTKNGNQWWKIDIDNQNIKKSNFLEIKKTIYYSQYFIIRNYSQEWGNKNTKKYKLYIIKWDKNTPYILPVKSVTYVIE